MCRNMSMPGRVPWLLLLVATLAGCASAPAVRPVAPAPTAPAAAPAPTRGWWPIAYSVQGRPLLVRQAGSGPLRVYLIGGVHGDEVEGRSMLDSLTEGAGARATLRVLRDLNPDGTAYRVRTNAHGRDLNRNWPASNFQPGATGGPSPLSEPETRALEMDLRAFKPDLVVVLHSIATGPLLNYDGPAESLAVAFVGAARGVDPDWHLMPDMGYPTSGSLGSYLGVDRGLPVLTVEFERGQDEASAAAALGKGIAAAITAAADRGSAP